MLGRKPLQPAFPASIMHVVWLHRSGQRAFGSLQTTKLLLTPGCHPRLALAPRFTQPSTSLACDPAGATLHRTMLTIPFSYRRGDHLEYLVRQGCHGKLLFVLLSDFMLFLVVSRAHQPRDWNGSSRSSTPRPVEIIAARASILLETADTCPSHSIITRVDWQLFPILNLPP